MRMGTEARPVDLLELKGVDKITADLDKFINYFRLVDKPPPSDLKVGSDIYYQLKKKASAFVEKNSDSKELNPKITYKGFRIKSEKS